ncbi:MAG: CPBP family intramembrane metalloprotease [Planctomycetota bacterium]|nr:CPBP family intramembrane metalloprotease [Planctomycetota bacterium]
MSSATQTSRTPWILILLAMILPTVSAYLYFDLLANSAPIAQKGAYGIGKMAQFGILIVALVLWRQPPSASAGVPETPFAASRWRWLAFGAASGMVIGVAMVAGYLVILKPMGIMDSAKLVAIEKMRSFGADSPLLLIAIAVFYAVLHSGFEEYYWRGLVFGGLKPYCRTGTAMLISSLAFMSHHVIILAKFFGYSSIATYLMSLAVATGGLIWAVLFQRSSSLVPGWISHAIVDAAIFFVGYLLVFG